MERTPHHPQWETEEDAEFWATPMGDESSATAQGKNSPVSYAEMTLVVVRVVVLVMVKNTF